MVVERVPTDRLTILGRTVRHAVEHVECFPAPEHVGLVRFENDELNSMCPVTEQPDLSNVVIEYEPDQWCVESKSLKLFLGTFRGHGAFHEACTMEIAGRLTALLDPVWFRIGAYWYPRGGMPIDVFWLAREGSIGRALGLLPAMRAARVARPVCVDRSRPVAKLEGIPLGNKPP